MSFMLIKMTFIIWRIVSVSNEQLEWWNIADAATNTINGTTTGTTIFISCLTYG